MKNRVYQRAFIVLTLVITAAFMTSGPALAAQHQTAIDKVRTNFNTAFNAADAKAMARLIDRDAVWMPPGEQAIAGKGNIAARYTDFFNNVRSTIDLKPGEIKYCGKLAFLSGSFTRADTPKADGTMKKASGHYLFVLKKQDDGNWRIARDIWNEAVSP